METFALFSFVKDCVWSRGDFFICDILPAATTLNSLSHLPSYRYPVLVPPRLSSKVVSQYSISPSSAL